MQRASAIGLYFDSWDSGFKKPFGAVPENTQVFFGISCDFTHKEKISRIDMEILYEGQKTFVEMKAEEEYFTLEHCFSQKGIYFYRFAVYYEGRRYYLGSDYAHSGGSAVLYEGESASYYQLTVHRQIPPVPEFYSEGIVYQIFVDRFCNGNKDGMPLALKKDSFVYAGWEDSPCYVKGEKGEIKRWDFYGGNLPGIIQKLDYLKDMGVTVIYLNPIFEARSCHKYDTGDYMKVDPMFGDEAIFRQLIEEAGRRNIHVILDGVFSHTGADSRYFNRFGNYESIGAYQSEDSAYFSWYRFRDFPEDYEAWWGIGDLPNVNEMEPSYLEFIIGDRGVAHKWMELGIKGFRLDVADELPEEFIRLLRQKLRSMDEEAVLLGEVWEDASNKIAYGKRREYLLGESLDSVTSYPFRKYLLGFLKGELSSKEMYNLFMSMEDNYPAEYYKSSLKMIGSHDVRRIRTELGSDDKVRMAATFQMLFLGTVHIYYGDEVGLEGEADPYNRATYPWDSYDYLGQHYEYPQGNPRKNSVIFEHYQKLTRIRKEERVIRKGAIEYLYPHPDVLAYRRFDEEEEIIVAVNRSKEKVNVVFEVEGKVYQALLREIHLEAEAERLEVQIPPMESMILKKVR